MIRLFFSTGARLRSRIPAPAVLSITERAAGRIARLLEQHGDREAVGVRLGVKSRGCNGLSYTMDYAREPKATDEIVREHGVQVFVDGRAVLFVAGATMDYVEDRVRSEFVFNNPNAKGMCGCGESFNV